MIRIAGSHTYPPAPQRALGLRVVGLRHSPSGATVQSWVRDELESTVTADDERLAALIADGISSDLAIEDALRRTGILIDLSEDHRSESGLETALGWTDHLLEQDLSDDQQSVLHYFIGNAWSVLHQLRHAGAASGWGWEIPEIEKQVLHYRTALKLAGRGGVEAVRRCQIHTNLGNLLNTIGRFVEAIEEWDRALIIDPEFPMAIGNRAKGLYHYALHLYDESHQKTILPIVLNRIEDALRGNLDGGARVKFEALLIEVREICESNALDDTFDLDGFDLGASATEVEYRRWCLGESLFVNPLNDLGPHTVAATDVLLLPSITLPGDEPPSLIGFYNQLKQEYVSARYLFHEGLTATQPHFSDRHVKLINTLDYPTYSLAVEKVKSAFRTCYSVLDKIAFFLNDYFKLGVPERSTNIRTIWYVNQQRRTGIRPEFLDRPNWPLRGLYWLTKDLAEKRTDFQQAMNPDAQEVVEIRNHLEHKYLKLHEDDWAPDPVEIENPITFSMDTLSYSVARSDFEHKALRALKLTRAALIYLSLAVHSEERNREPSVLAMAMTTDTWDDDWKY